MISGSMHRSPGICLMAEEKPRKPQLGDSLMKAVRPVIASNGVSRIAQHIRKERSKGQGKMAVHYSYQVDCCEKKD